MEPGELLAGFDPVFLPVLIRSVGYALATAVCLLIGYPVAYYIAVSAVAGGTC